MSDGYILLERVYIQSANCVAGLTYGFPAISHFLGFSHALQLKMQKVSDLQIEGCAVFCHEHDSLTYQANGFGDHTFIQRKSSPTFKKHAQSTPPIIEEGKMNFCVSLLLKCTTNNINRESELKQFNNNVSNKVHQLRLAGGVITKIKSVSFYQTPNDEENKKAQIARIKKRLMPSFVLCDRKELLAQHHERMQEDSEKPVDLLEAWLDFSKLSFVADKEPDVNGRFDWQLQKRPTQGWLVPIMTGYTSISPLFDKGSIQGARSVEYPFAFVEAVYSIAEWQSTHRISNLSNLIWQYDHSENWYLCKQPANEVCIDEDNRISNQGSSTLNDEFDFSQ